MAAIQRRDRRYSKRRRRFESLERRNLLDAHLLADVNTTLVDIEPSDMTVMGETAFFFAQDGLWKTDGTTVGTELVRELERAPSRSHQMTVVRGSRLIFTATDEDHGTEVWTSDGTREGTSLLRDFKIGPGDGVADYGTSFTFVTDDDWAYFRTELDDSSSLWRTDGTPEGTETVATFDEQVFSGISMHTFGGNIYFSTAGEIWKSNGTSEGTVRVAAPANALNNIDIEAVNDGYVFFSLLESVDFADSFRASWGLWRTDGTPDGLQRLQSINPAAETVLFGEQLFFAEPDTQEVWQTDGTVAGTQSVTQLPQVSTVIGMLDGRLLLGTNPQPVVGGAATAFFGPPPLLANELWSYDVTNDRTEFLSDLWRYYDESDSWIIDDTAYFLSGGDFWMTDGTADGTNLVQAEVRPEEVVVVGDQLLLDNSGKQLWASQGIPGSTNQIQLDIGLSKDSMPTSYALGVPAFQDIGADSEAGNAEADTTLFIASNELWKTDGTEVGTQQVRAWNTSYAQFIAAPFRGHAVFEIEGMNEIWVSDGTEAGTRKVGDGSFMLAFHQTPDDVYFRTSGGELLRLDSDFELTEIASFASTRGLPNLYSDVVNDRIVFQAVGGECQSANCVLEVHAIELGSSDVQLLARFESTTAQEEERFAKVGDRLVFVATDADHGRELWSTDGTVDGTELFFETVPGARSNDPINLMPLRDSVVFETADIARDGTLWRTDGTASGTSVIADEFVSRTPRLFRQLEHRLVFVGQNHQANTELWLTDGTRAGTQIVDIFPGEKPSIPEFLTESDGIVYFSADDGVHGRELWSTDGTAENTRLVQDINVGPDGSLPTIGAESLWLSKFVNDPIGSSHLHGGAAYFSATTNQFGRELWKTDGTPEGTRLVVDIAEGKQSSSPHAFTVIDNTLFFAADGDLGFEPWVYSAGPDPLPGDADGDGEVSFQDFLIVSAHFGKQVESAREGDFDGDDIVTFSDFLLLSANFGQRRILIADHDVA